MTLPRVTVVILNTDRRDDTLACLASLQASNGIRPDILVLDNSSLDGSVQAIRSAYPTVDILELPRNLGYAGNNNLGLQAALGRGAAWVLVLNEDVVLARDSLVRLVQAVDADPTIGIAGPMVYHHDAPTIIQSAGGRLDRRWRSSHRGLNQPDHGQFAGVQEVDWISGCALMVRREVIEKIGGLDERFFYYWEETEWCLRARRAGWRIAFVPQSKIWHKGVQLEYRPAPNVTYYWTRNWLMMLDKHRAPVLAWLTVAGWIARNSLSWSLLPKWRAAMPAHRLAMWQGALDFLRHRWGMRPT